MKKFFVILLSALLLFAFSSCTTTQPGVQEPNCDAGHTDSDGNFVCDICGESLKAEEPIDGVELIKNGEAIFQFVYSDDLPSSVKIEIKSVIARLKSIGITVGYDVDTKDGVRDCEVIVGTVTKRGDAFSEDYHELGLGGMVMKIVDGKVHLSGGSADDMLVVLRDFTQNALGLGIVTQSITNSALLRENTYEIIPSRDGYKFTSVEIAGEDAKGYCIAVDKRNNNLVGIARDIQDYFYKYSGYWFEIESLTESTDRAIALRLLSDSGEGDGFNCYLSGKNLYIDCEKEVCFSEAVKSLLSQKFDTVSGNLQINSDFSYSKDVRSVYYSDYITTIDTTGNTNAFFDMKAVHDYANEYGLTVKARPTDKFLITETKGEQIIIKTDVDWSSATITIDDRYISQNDSKYDVFKIVSDYKVQILNADSDLVKAINNAGGIDKDEINSSLNFFGYNPGFEKAMLVIYNDNNYVYIRQGVNSDQGSVQRELIVIDGEGNIDPNTTLLLDYDEVTRIYVYRVDDKPITVSGGIIITRANRETSATYMAYARGISVLRSNTTIRGIEHRITDEGDRGVAYGGFINVHNCNNFLLEDAILQAHRTYKDAGGVGMGTYELGGGMANGLYYKNCVQSNFYDDSGMATTYWRDENGDLKSGVGIWGVMGTNFCKNITYDGCTLNRLDAHAGVVNATVKDTNIIEIRLIGGGLALIENSTVYNSTMISLREDYGSTWNGDVKIINSKQINNSWYTPTIISGKWVNHNFGYTTYMPKNVIIDGYTLVNKKNTSAKTVNVITYSNLPSNADANNKSDNPIVYNESITVRNNSAGITFNPGNAGRPITKE